MSAGSALSWARLELEAERRERRAQLVRGIGRELALTGHQPAATFFENRPFRAAPDRHRPRAGRLARCPGREVSFTHASRDGRPRFQRPASRRLSQSTGEGGQRQHADSDRGDHQPRVPLCHSATAA